MFQTLKGSLQTSLEAGKILREPGEFQTLKGSLQTEIEKGNATVIMVFQTLKGSLQTFHP